MNRGPVVLFVCEHGSAKSVVAAAHFNRLAGERGLEVRAVSRGTDPDEVIAPGAATGLRADGLEPGEPTPRKLSQADVSGAVRVVTFCELLAVYVSAAQVERWEDVPPVSEDYAKARDAMLVRVRRLLDQLDAGTQPASGRDKPH